MSFDHALNYSEFSGAHGCVPRYSVQGSSGGLVEMSGNAFNARTHSRSSYELLLPMSRVANGISRSLTLENDENNYCTNVGSWEDVHALSGATYVNGQANFKVLGSGLPQQHRMAQNSLTDNSIYGTHLQRQLSDAYAMFPRTTMQAASLNRMCSGTFNSRLPYDLSQYTSSSSLPNNQMMNSHGSISGAHSQYVDPKQTTFTSVSIAPGLRSVNDSPVPPDHVSFWEGAIDNPLGPTRAILNGRTVSFNNVDDLVNSMPTRFEVDANMSVVNPYSTLSAQGKPDQISQSYSALSSYAVTQESAINSNDTKSAGVFISSDPVISDHRQMETSNDESGQGVRSSVSAAHRRKLPEGRLEDPRVSIVTDIHDAYAGQFSEHSFHDAMSQYSAGTVNSAQEHSDFYVPPKSSFAPSKETYEIDITAQTVSRASSCLFKPGIFNPDVQHENSNHTASPASDYEDAEGFEYRETKDDFLLRHRRSGLSYKEIRQLGGFSISESTLRGRFRMLTKNKMERVRQPKWTEKDVRLLRKAVQRFSRSSAKTKNKLSWKKVAEYIATNGGTYRFGFGTCKKKWDALVEVDGAGET